MFCPKCGKEVSGDDAFCRACGAALQEAEKEPSAAVETSEKKKSGKKTGLIIAAALVAVIAGWLAVRAYGNSTAYQAAVESYEGGAYAEAAEGFVSLGDYKDAAEYAVKSRYQQAKKDLDAKEYDQAIAVLAELGDYEDSAKLLEKAFLARKYAAFNLNVDIDSEFLRDVALRTQEEVESAMQESMYGEWYNAETGEKLIVDRDRINGREYGVSHATSVDGFCNVMFYYLNEPEDICGLLNFYEYFDFIDEQVHTLSLFPADSEVGDLYRSVTQEEYDDLLFRNAEAEAQQPAYADNEIIEKTFTTFRNKVRGNYSGVGVLYHSASYSEAYVEYDPASRTYYCSMTGEYSTNGFDIWGTSTQTYFVNAAYADTGAGLSLISISIN